MGRAASGTPLSFDVGPLMHSFVLFLVTFAGLIVASSLNAADTPHELAKQFVTLMKCSEQHQEYRNQCMAAAQAIPPESLARQNPERFYGIRPGTKLWPEVVKAYELYYQQAFERPTQTEFVDALAQAYEKELSANDLRQTISFYSTSTGKRLIAAHQIATRNVYQEWSRLNSKQIPIADRNFDRRMLELSQKAVEK